MGRASRSWEDSPGEQPRGGAGGRGRRGRGRGSPHLSGNGDASTADRKSKVGAEQGLESSGEAPRGPVSLSVPVLKRIVSFIHLPLFLFRPLSSALFHFFPLSLPLSLPPSFPPSFPPPDQCL